MADAPKKILIIEDEEIISDLLAKKLSQIGYEVKVAFNGQEGLEMLYKEKPDLVLIDIVMPKKDGFETIAEMKGDETLKGIPVIIISNSGQPVELDKAREMGVQDWLIKTDFDPQEVLVKVKKQIG
ncbi:MAG: response regulator [Candidatus Pacebacteria bacterium]|nr:response regulator [Candidatus Paceibacterota bacterium]